MRFLLIATLIMSAGSAAACPVAEKSYTARISPGLSTKFYFNKDCTEAIQNYRGNITKHKMVKKGRGWEFKERDELYRWNLSRTGKSIRLTGPEWSFNHKLLPHKEKSE